LEGHIFDKNMINDVLNICEDNALTFRIVELVVGNSAEELTTVTIQGMSFNDTMLDEAEAQIRKKCLETGAIVSSG